MEDVKTSVAEYHRIKEDMKKLGDRKKLLEAEICKLMDQFEIESFELPDGTFLVFSSKHSLKPCKTLDCKKEKGGGKGGGKGRGKGRGGGGEDD